MSQSDDAAICNHDTAELITSSPDVHHDDQEAADAPIIDISSEDSASDPMSASSVRVLQPQDDWNLIYVSLLLAGVGFLLPYNSFITAVDYFLDKYPGSTIVFDMSLTYILVAFVSVILNNALVESYPLHVRVSLKYLIESLV